MPHAIITNARTFPTLDEGVLRKDERRVFRVVETARTKDAWLLKCVLVTRGIPRKFLARVDERKDGFHVRLDDHVSVERDDDVFAFLGLVVGRILAENPEATLGATNLTKYIPTPVASGSP